MPNYVASVGMEVHAELSTRSKMFCRCPAGFGGEPNTRVCPVCLALPGSLPVPNKAAIEMVIRTSLALNCQISMASGFQRKNYFYPDLPKGYQISQYTHPIGHSGWLDIPAKEGGTKRIHIRRVHLEEDTGKLMHLPSGGGIGCSVFGVGDETGQTSESLPLSSPMTPHPFSPAPPNTVTPQHRNTGLSGVDYNRAGVPLMEIVTEFPPDITNGEEAKEYLTQLRLILMFLGVCDGKMEEGSLRAEPNISIRPEGSETYGVKTELKNLGSFRSVQLGVKFEVARQTAILDAGGEVHQETRGWNEQKEESFLMRRKETENDYRYFPDPDLAPMAFEGALIEELRGTIPELPLAKRQRYEGLGISPKHAETLAGDANWAAYFDEAVSLGGDPQAVCNWMISDFAMRLNEEGLAPGGSKVKPAHFVELTGLIKAGTISGKIGKEVFAEMFATGRAPSNIVEEQGSTQISDRGSILSAVRGVLAANTEATSKYKAGQTNVKGFLVGQVMRATGGRANPGLVQEIVQEELEK